MGRDVIIACDFNSKEEVINFLGKFKEEKPPEGEEVLAYHPSWIDEDFNPRGLTYSHS